MHDLVQLAMVLKGFGSRSVVPAVGLKRPSQNGAIEGDAVMASVGHRDEPQTAFRHQEQIGELMLGGSGIESAGQMVYGQDA